MPIEKNLHWSLAVVANLDVLGEAGTDVLSSSSSSSPRAPCIVFMDSLGMHDSDVVCKQLRQYLVSAWRDKRGRGAAAAEIETVLANLPVVKPCIPIQSNYTDCGVFCVQYAEEFLARWPHIDADTVMTNSIPGFNKKMFTPTDMLVS